LIDVRIYRPARTAMQSGIANTKRWVLEFEPASPRATEPLMGWTSSPDTRGQVCMHFATRDDAVAFAERNGLSYRVAEPRERVIRPKSYSDNFRYDRVQ